MKTNSEWEKFNEQFYKGMWEIWGGITKPMEGIDISKEVKDFIVQEKQKSYEEGYKDAEKDDKDWEFLAQQSLKAKLIKEIGKLTKNEVVKIVHPDNSIETLPSYLYNQCVEDIKKIIESL